VAEHDKQERTGPDLAGRPPSRAQVTAAVSKLEAPLAAAVKAAGAVFPPDFVLSNGTSVDISGFKGPASAGSAVGGAEAGKWRPYDGAGQYPKLPYLGGSGAPFSLCVKSTHESTKLPAAADVVNRLHVRSELNVFLPNPNNVSGVLLAFATMVAREVGLGGAGGDINAMSSYLDLQLLYGCSAEECAKIRTGAAGKIAADAVVGPARY